MPAPRPDYRSTSAVGCADPGGLAATERVKFALGAHWPNHADANALRDHALRLEALLVNAPLGVAFFDREHRYVQINDTLAAINGIAAAEHLGRTIEQLLPRNAEVIAPVIDRVFATGQSVADFEVTGETPREPGITRHWLVGAHPVHDDNGDVAWAGVWVIEITERKRAHDALALSERFNRSLLDSSPDCIKVLDIDGRLLTMNGPGQCAMEIDDFAPQAGRAWREFWPDAALVDAALQRARAGAVGRFQGLCPTAKGTPKWWDVIVTAVRGSDGRIERLLATSRDITEQKQAEHALRVSDARFGAAFHSNPLPMWLMRFPEGRYIEVNGAFEAVVGRSRTQLVGHTSAEIGLYQDPARRAEYFRLLAEQGSVKGFEVVIRGHDGKLRHIELNADVLEVDSARFVLGAGVDITERKQAQAVQAEQSRQLDLLARVSEQLILADDSETLLPGVFAEIAELLGAQLYFHYRVDAQPGSLRLQHSAGLDMQQREQFTVIRFGELLCGRVAAGRSSLVIDDLSRCGIADAEVVANAGIHSYAGFPLLAHGRLQGTIAFASRRPQHFDPAGLRLAQRLCDQIAAELERSQLLRELAEKQALLRGVTDNAHVGLWLVDRQLRLRFVNPAWPKMIGLAPNAELIGRPIADVVGPAIAEVSGPVIDSALAGRTTTFESTGRAPAAHAELPEAVRQVTVLPMRGATGQIEGALGVAADITERKRYEAEREGYITALKASDRRKDEFLAMLAHELRNPLAPIRNAVEIMRNGDAGAGTIERARDMIGRQVTHLTRLVDDLLDVSRVTQGKIKLDKVPLDLAAIAYAGLELTRPVIDANRQRLTLVLPPPGELWVDGDAARLAQVIGNLLNNASKYTDTGGTITLRASALDDAAVIEVEDTGVGIAAELLPQVFDLFTQAERSLDRAQGGLGIGLSLVKRLVHMHGGTVAAASGGLGQGSRFTVRLPLGSPPQQPSPALRGRATQPQARRVLIVDDNCDAAQSIALLLQLQGHEVRCEYDARSAIETAEAFAPTVCVLDIGLPGMDGYQLAQRLRESPEVGNALFVALTGYGQAEDKSRALAAGFDHHLTKPVEPDVLYSTVSAQRPGHRIDAA